MKKLDEILKEGMEPGSRLCRVCLSLTFFVFGLLFIFVGFWRTLLVLALTALGYFLGASKNPVESVKGVINKVVPPANRTVTYSKEDMEKVQKALEKKEKSKQETPDEDAQKTPVQKD